MFEIYAVPFTILEIYAVQINPIALRKAKIVYNFGLFECNRVNTRIGRKTELKLLYMPCTNSVCIVFINLVTLNIEGTVTFVIG